MIRNQFGNVIFYILIAVGLLAALSYVVAKNTRGNSGGSQERVSLSSTEILEYVNSLSNAVAQLRLRGCQESQISFDNLIEDSIYDNSSAPSDGSCDVFGVNGGGLQYSQSLTYLITGDYIITDVGSASPDLVIDVTVDKAVCERLNSNLGISNNGSEGPPSDTMTGGSPFDGSFSPAGGSNVRLDDAQLIGKPSACRHDSGSGASPVYKYYAVLMAR